MTTTHCDWLVGFDTTDGLDGLVDPGVDAWCGDEEVEMFLQEQEHYENEPPCCSICDGMGHGYPGGGPCPLEERGGYDLAEAMHEAWIESNDEGLVH